MAATPRQLEDPTRMHIDITARHDTLTDALRTHVTERFGHALRLADDVTTVHVILNLERTRHSAEVVVHGRNLAAAVHADGEDHFVAVDRCADKLRHQLEHHLGKRRDKRRRNPGLAAMEAEVAAAALAASLDAPTPSATEPSDTAAAPAPAASIDDIVRTRLTNLAPRTVEDVRVELESSGREFLVFRDAQSEQVSVLYRRGNGQFGLIETGAA
jgi:putative sigma-54 modulation protein